MITPRKEANSKPSRTDESCAGGLDQPISSEPAPSHRPWASARARPRADNRSRPPPQPGAQWTLQRQAVLAVRLHDETLLAGFADGQLSRAFGPLGGVHDLVAQLVIPRLVAHVRQSLCDIRLLDLAPWRRGGGRRTGGGEPQSPGIELQQARRLRGGIAELETQLDGGQLRSRPCEQ